MRRKIAPPFLINLLLLYLPYAYSFSPRGAIVTALKQPGQAEESLTKKTLLQHTKLYSKDDDSDALEKSIEPLFVRGCDDSEISKEALEAIGDSEPSEWVVMKEILGINIFTYILAALIVVFLTANFVLGPGWLGQAIGMKGAGTFTDISPSLPDTVDLNDPKFLL
jgi:hypothetical protein